MKNLSIFENVFRDLWEAKLVMVEKVIRHEIINDFNAIAISLLSVLKKILTPLAHILMDMDMEYVVRPAYLHNI